MIVFIMIIVFFVSDIIHVVLYPCGYSLPLKEIMFYSSTCIASIWMICSRIWWFVKTYPTIHLIILHHSGSNPNNTSRRFILFTHFAHLFILFIFTFLFPKTQKQKTNKKKSTLLSILFELINPISCLILHIRYIIDPVLLL